jgi:transcriptional activator of cad operon
MDRLATTTLRIGEWSVDPLLGQISRGAETIRVEARTMRLLLCLAENAGEVVSIDDLLTQVWPGLVVTPDSVYQAVASLRRLLGDDPKQPRYIVTLPRLGYRMIAPVNSRIEDSVETHEAHTTKVHAPRRAYGILATAIALAAICVAIYFIAVRDSPASASIAVVPFVDLTDDMNEEPFADGMTEELINKLSQVQGLRVKALKVTDIPKSRGVGYVLEGSVRKSGTTLRIAARLARASDGYVVWSATYDRPFDDKLMVQDDIASEVSRALRVSFH